MASLYNAVQSAALNTSLGATPAGNDEIFLTYPNVDYTSNLTTGVDLRRFMVSKEYQGNFTSALVTTANQAGAGIVQYQGSGQEFNLNCAGGTVATFEFTPKAGSCKSLVSNGTVTTLIQTNGNLIVADTLDANAIVLTKGSQLLTETATHVTNSALVSGGTLVVKRPCNAFEIAAGGRVEVRETSVVAIAPSGTIKILGGTLDYAGSSPSGVLTLASGTLDFSKLRKNISLAAGSVAYPGSTVVKPGPGIVVTYPTSWEQAGGPTYV